MILDVCEEIYWNCINKIKKIPRNFKCNDKTLDLAIDEVKQNCPWFIKSNEEMKESGVRYRNLLFIVDNSLDDNEIEIIYDS